MFEVTVSGTFSAAHNLRGYCGNCETLHGHNYKVEVVVRRRVLDKLGIAADFRLLKEKLKETLASFDHKYLNTVRPFNKVNATAENIAKEIFKRLRHSIKPLQLVRVMVYESENAYVTYSTGK